MNNHEDEPDKNETKTEVVYANNCNEIKAKRRSLLLENHAEEADNNGKVADSAYSNSCSNSQSRRSTSSKSTHSGSNSSGYGGKISTNGSSVNLEQSTDIREKENDAKRKKPCLTEKLTLDPPKEEDNVESENNVSGEVNVSDIKEEYVVRPSLVLAPPEAPQAEYMEIATTDISAFKEEDGFSCVISMLDGVVMYTTSSLTSSLGFPKDIWIGRSFMNFIHPKDCNTFASHILGLISPKIVNGFCQSNAVTTIFCRIRKYRGLTTGGFGVKDHDVTYIPFLLKFSFKNINEREGTAVYLVIHATQCCSAYKTPCEVINKAIPFVIRHIANGNFEYLDPESVPYLGYLPQDVNDKCALQLYHPEDMSYLRDIYEIIVKEGSAPRSRPYRMLAQNGHYIRLETEWSSFINPWSRKLEFVIGKHHVVEGPLNPDVFRPTDIEKVIALSEDDKINSKLLGENIIRIMNEVLTKPSEVAKQQMSKRCQHLTTFMEKLMEEQKFNNPFKTGPGDRNSYYERDSVMLGGISPHRDYNDSDSSTGTPLRYNQLNYSENIQRYFDSREPFLEDDAQHPETNMLAIEGSHLTSSKKSTTDNGSGDSGDSGGATSSGESSYINLPDSSSTSSSDRFNYIPVRLTESILNKHNSEMEKKLIKKHRETRTVTRGDRDNLAIEARPKKKEYRNTHSVDPQCHGLKRNARHLDEPGCSKHQKVSLVRQTTTRNSNTFGPMQVETLNVHHIMPVTRPVPGMFPMYYMPTHNSMENSINKTTHNCAHNNHSSAVQYMMYPHAVFGSPFVYSSVPPQVSFGPATNTIVREEQANPRYSTSTPSMGLTWSNYDKVCKSSLPYKPPLWSSWRDKKPKEPQPSTSIAEPREGNISSTNALNRSTEAVPVTSISAEVKNTVKRANRQDEVNERTDGESSYSSFYSSLLKTPSQSADDSMDSKKKELIVKSQEPTSGESGKSEEQQTAGDDKFKEYQIRNKKVTKRKMEPPWMEDVSLTSDMIYKYKIDCKSQAEILSMDKEKINKFEQPSLVNEQLGQLYLDLQLAGVAAQLTLEEGYTSESSGDENTSSVKASQRNWKFSKLSFIHQEDAPLPPLPVEENTTQVSAI